MTAHNRATRCALCLAAALGACTPSALQFHQLSPVRTKTVYTAADYYATQDSVTRSKAPLNAAQIVILHTDSVIATVSIYELEDIFWMDVYVYNAGSAPFVVNPSQIILMDATRIAFRPLPPDQAANLYAGKVSNIAPYQPKYTYSVQSSTQGYMSVYGNNAYYSGTTQSTVTATEDPYNALGYNIGASIARDRNQKFLNMAGALYTVGFVEGSSIPGKTGAHGGIYWFKQRNWIWPLILRFAQSNYELEFTPPPQ